MNKSLQSILDVRTLIGLFIVIAGVLVLLDNLGAGFDIDIWEWWPVILILLGISYWGQSSGRNGSVGSWVLIAVGVLLLLNNLDVIHLSFNYVWPIILIIIGVAVLKHGLGGGGTAENTDENYINVAFILGGGTQQYGAKTLNGGRVAAIMGGGKIDLRNAGMTASSITIDVFTLWGGVEIIVPRNWTVNMQGVPILGGMDNKCESAGAGEIDDPSVPTLIIKGTAIMGGVEVKN